MLKRVFALSLLTVFAVALVACGDEDVDAPGDPGVGTPTPTPTPAGEPTPAPTPALDDEDEDIESFDFAEGENVFDVVGVNSFRQRWVVSMSGPGVEGTEMAGTMEMESDFVQDPPSSHVRMTAPDGTVMFEIIRIEGTAWFGGAGMPWQQVDTLPFDPEEMFAVTGLITPEALVGEEDVFTAVGEEEIHGRQTTHYRIDEATMMQLMEADPDLQAADISEAQIDYWVDEGGRFIVRYEMVIQGTDLDLEEDIGGEEGRMEVLFELFDFDADISIEPPE